jgi:PAT family beta-lactamase induction signal transducer AmpG
MFQDIATDSLVIDITPIEQQGKANSLMWGSKTIGTSFSLFVGSWLIIEYGFSNAQLAMSVFVLAIIFVPLSLTERKGEKLLPWSKGSTSPESTFLIIDSWGKLFKSFLQVILLRNTTLLLVAVFTTMTGVHFMITLLPIFTIQDLGWNSVYYSKIFSTYNLIGGVIGMAVGGLIIKRFGIAYLIQGSLILSAILSISMASLTSFWRNTDLATAFIAVYCTLRTLIYIGVLALAMHLCWKRISAIQFTFCMTVFNGGLAFGAALLGYLRSYFGWQTLFMVFAIMMVMAMAVLAFIKTNRHREQVEILEKNYVDILKKEGSLLVKSETT